MPSGRGEGGAPSAAGADGVSGADGAPWLYGLLALGFLAVFLASVRSVLSPLVLFILALYVLWPRVGRPTYRRLAVVASAVFALWVVDTTGLLLAPFLLAAIFAYILDPLVDRLEARRIPRAAAVALLALPLLGVLAFVAFVLAPAAVRQASEFAADLPEYLEVVRGWLRRARVWIVGLGIPGLDAAAIPRPEELDAEAIVSYVQAQREALARGGLQAVLGIGRGVGAVLTGIAYLVLLPILTFYLLRDWHRVLEQLRGLIPPEHRERVVGFAARYDDLLSRYLRGQLLLSAIVGFVFWLGFTIVGFPYALLLGLLAAVFNLVPYLGFAVTLVVALVVALFSGAILSSLGKLAIVLVVEQVVEQVVGPLIVGESVGLHPVWVILALALFSFFFGFFGLLIAVPAAVFLKLVAEDWLGRYRESTFYRGEGSPAPEAGPTSSGSPG